MLIGVNGMRVRFRKKGMTLLEIIIAMAILGIIAVVLLNAFVQGFSTIFSMGNKTRAMTTAQELIDKACEAGSTGALSGITSLTEVADEKDLYIYEDSEIQKYYVSTQTIGGVTYDKVTISIFYQKGRGYVILTSLIP